MKKNATMRIRVESLDPPKADVPTIFKEYFKERERLKEEEKGNFVKWNSIDFLMPPPVMPLDSGNTPQIRSKDKRPSQFHPSWHHEEEEKLPPISKPNLESFES